MSVGLVASTIAKIRSMYPESADAWSDAIITNAIYMVDLLTKERAESMWDSYDITLQENGLYYDLPERIIWMGAVSFGIDGSTFKDGMLTRSTLADMDEKKIDWENQKGSKPTEYVLLSTPGIRDYSKIILWPAMSSVTAQKVRLEYIACYNQDLSFLSQQCDQWVVEDIYAPMVAALLAASRDVDRAGGLFTAAVAATSRLFTQSRAKYGDFYSPFDTNDHRLTE